MIWHTWVTEIKADMPRIQFVDEQRGGPYKFWHHLHQFEPTEGGTLIKDEINYALPLWLIGNIAHDLFVKKMHVIFQYRKEILSKKFG
ncbi:MAG: hypothetical protein ABGZ19_11040 [Verrucomicrobiales bacterium]